MQYGARAQYQCNTGHEIVSGDEFLTCNEEEEWIGTIPTCQIISCPILNPLINGSISGTYTYNSVVNFTCNIGYVLTGNAQLTCQANKSWNGSVPTCSLIQCEDPVSLENGNIFGDSNSYGSSINFTCIEGYSLNGTETITCQSNGLWTSSFPICSQVNCGDPGVPDNGRQNPNAVYVFNSQVSFSCFDGYELVGSSIILCQANGTWSNIPPQCSVINCVTPVLPANVIIVSGDSYTFNTTIIFSCSSGYTLIGNSSSVCTKNKEWSNNIPKCLRQCPNLELSVSVILTPQKDVYLEGDLLSFSCSQGYYLEGANTILCDASGNWNTTVPTCYSKPCQIKITLF